MEIVVSFLQILLPSMVAVIGIYLVVKTMLQKDFDGRQLEARTRNTGTVLPLRLQAYERIALLLERTSPHNLLPRVSNSAYNVAEFQQRLVAEIREETNHNLSQQIYMSDQAWELSKSAVEDIVTLINSSAQNLDPSQPGLSLARAVFETLIQRQEDPTERALKFLKEEIRQVY